MKNQNRIIGLLFMIGCVMIILGTTYAFIHVQLKGEKKQIITAGTLSLELLEDENNIQLENALPMYDEVGMLQNPFTFRLVNNGSEDVLYILKLAKIKQVNELDEKLVRFHLNKNKNQDVFGGASTLSSLSIGDYSSETRQEALKVCQDF